MLKILQLLILIIFFHLTFCFLYTNAIIMKGKINKLYGFIISKLLAVLGFATSCGPPVAEYGTPYANYKVSGQVTSANTEMPIGQIEVEMFGETSVTNAKGNYQIIVSDFPGEPVYDVFFKDVDGAEQGEYQDLDTLVDFNKPIFRNGDGDWYEGEASRTLNVELEPKE
jgi:putative lipoprotein (rSAM/lipoprotein system)